MKYSNTVISAVIAVAVLLAALAIGLSIREYRLRRAEFSQTDIPGARRGTRMLSAKEREELKEQKQQALKEMENMSEEEKEKFRAQMREQFSPKKLPRPTPRNLSEEEKAKLLQRLNLPDGQKQSHRTETVEDPNVIANESKTGTSSQTKNEQTKSPAQTGENEETQ